MWKWTKRLAGTALIVGVAGFLLFGTQVYSYVTSSGRMIQETVEENVPFEFQIRRARDMLDELVPQMHANIKLIAREEVEIADLERQIDQERESLADERARIRNLRDALKEEQVSYTFGGHQYDRNAVVKELDRRFEHFQTAEYLLESKEKLLQNRRQSLAAARRKLDEMRRARLELQAQVKNLESQFRLVQTESADSKLNLDHSKVAQVRKVLRGLRKRLDVAQRVLAHESRFVENIPVDSTDEAALLDSIDAHFEGGAPEKEALPAPESPDDSF